MAISVVDGYDESYQYKSFKNTQLNFTSNDNGEAWVILGTDSGFEGKTTIYFDDVEINFE